MMQPETPTSDKKDKGKLFIFFSFLISIYIFFYASVTIWLLFDGWINEFSSLYGLWNITGNNHFPNSVNLILFSTLGSILGGAVLSITSFHRYMAVEKNFDKDHFWGFIFTPMLSSIMGIIIFTLIQSGLLVFSGTFSESEQPMSATLGFTAIGCIAGYNWDAVIIKLQKLSTSVIRKSDNQD